jgi:hypothetical protein
VGDALYNDNIHLRVQYLKIAPTKNRFWPQLGWKRGKFVPLQVIISFGKHPAHEKSRPHTHPRIKTTFLTPLT